MSSLHLSVWLTIAVLLAGCGETDMTDLKNNVKRINARPPAPIEPLPEMKPVETFVYEPGERRNPFQSDAKTATAAAPLPTDSGPTPDPNRAREELENYPLDSLNMVGTLEQHSTRWALVRTREGVVHRVTIGNYLGQNHGQIIAINQDSLQLTEIVSDAPGQWRERPATVALSQ